LRQHRTPGLLLVRAYCGARTPGASTFSALIAAVVVLAGAARAADLQVEGTPRGTHVIVDGRLAGTLPLAQPIVVGAGAHRVRLELPGYRPVKTQFEASSIASVFSMRYDLQPIEKRQEALAALAIAGNGQRAMGHSVVGSVLTAIEAGGLVMAISGEGKFRNDRDQFNEAEQEYAAALSPATINAARSKANGAYDAMGRSETLRNVGIGVAAAAVAVGFADFWLRTPPGAKTDPSAPSETGGLETPLPVALASAVRHFRPDIRPAAVGGSFWCSF
jgi:hypothetical protein